jgi:hypothetical protein
MALTGGGSAVILKLLGCLQSRCPRHRALCPALFLENVAGRTSVICMVTDLALFRGTWAEVANVFAALAAMLRTITSVAGCDSAPSKEIIPVCSEGANPSEGSQSRAGRDEISLKAPEKPVRILRYHARSEMPLGDVVLGGTALFDMNTNRCAWLACAACGPVRPLGRRPRSGRAGGRGHRDIASGWSPSASRAAGRSR